MTESSHGIGDRLYRGELNAGSWGEPIRDDVDWFIRAQACGDGPTPSIVKELPSLIPAKWTTVDDRGWSRVKRRESLVEVGEWSCSLWDAPTAGPGCVSRQVELGCCAGIYIVNHNYTTDTTGSK